MQTTDIENLEEHRESFQELSSIEKLNLELQKIIKLRGERISKIASRLNMPYPTVKRVFDNANKQSPSIETVEKVAFYGLKSSSINELLGKLEAASYTEVLSLLKVRFKDLEKDFNNLFTVKDKYEYLVCSLAGCVSGVDLEELTFSLLKIELRNLERDFPIEYTIEMRDAFKIKMRERVESVIQNLMNQNVLRKFNDKYYLVVQNIRFPAELAIKYTPEYIKLSRVGEKMDENHLYTFLESVDTETLRRVNARSLACYQENKADILRNAGKGGEKCLIISMVENLSSLKEVSVR